MTKVEIARRVADRAEIPERQAEELLEWILDLLKSSLRKGEDITIVGLAGFAFGVRMLASDGTRALVNKS
jgi:nucleoid DNA-binding protein